MAVTTVSPLDEPGLDKPGLDKSGRAIQDMFAGVAPRYDLLNRVLSGWLDVVWRRAAARSLAAVDGPVLDLCCGTGDQALALRRPGRPIAAADFCLPMLALARPKYARATGGRPRPAGLAADALTLPFPDRHFAAATVSFGLRNVADLDRALAELARVLRPGGRLAVLEIALPRAPILRRFYLFYFVRVLPRIGAWLSPRGSAYDYLPNSVLGFPQRDGFTLRMSDAGFVATSFRDLTFGTVCLYQGQVPASSPAAPIARTETP